MTINAPGDRFERRRPAAQEALNRPHADQPGHSSTPVELLSKSFFSILRDENTLAWLRWEHEKAEIRMGRIFEKRKESIFKTAAQKSKLYSKYGKQLYMAAKNGVPDPEANPTLRSLVERAKRDNVANHVIEKAIQKAAGAGGEDFQAARYEGFGPGGSLLIIECLTDNSTRTISDVRSCFYKTGSKLAANGSVVMSFDHLAVLSFPGDDEEKVIEAMFAADVAVEEVECEDGTVTIFAPPVEFYKAKTALLEAFPGLELEIQEIRFLPQTSKSLSGEELGQFEKLLGMLNESDDVQEIYHNITLPS